jgi:hypothetical protein
MATALLSSEKLSITCTWKTRTLVPLTSEPVRRCVYDKRISQVPPVHPDTKATERIQATSRYPRGLTLFHFLLLSLNVPLLSWQNPSWSPLYSLAIFNGLKCSVSQVHRNVYVPSRGCDVLHGSLAMST